MKRGEFLFMKKVVECDEKDLGKKLFFENFAKDFDEKMNRYDLSVRLHIVFNELLPEDIRGKRLLDAGCGTGYFSVMAFKKGAIVTSMDVGVNLLNMVAKKCESKRVLGSVLNMEFEDDKFDLIICSEVIEHTENPFNALREFYRVLKPGGTLALTVPNRFWKWSVILANALKLRPYGGLENWVDYKALKQELDTIGFHIKKYGGFHLFPFQLSFLHPILRKLDNFGEILGPFYINISAGCQK